MDRLGELLLLAGQVAFGVLGQLIGEDEQAVERRPQFVAHVRQELGLVLDGERQLLRLLFQRLTGLFDFRVLPLDFLILVREELGLLLQLLVRVLQFLLASLELLCQRLGLLEQILRPHVRFDRVEHDADRLGELFEERLVRGVEAAERGEFEHAADLAFEDQRQHEDASRRRRAEPRRDADVVRRQVVEQDLLLLQRALPDQPLPEADALADRALPFRTRNRPAA